MCGFTGYFGTDLPTRANIDIAIQSLGHRGPDGSGTFINKDYQKKVLLTHNRLAILDLNDRSDQPFVYKDKVVVFNGEIYNYIEIKNELKDLGHCFETKSDTEVLVHALEEWDLEALHKLEGMWAFCCFDMRSGDIMLSRDRFGEKPLYLSLDSDEIFFSSEIKGIQALKRQKLEVNVNHLIRYMVNGYKSLYKSSDTFFHGITEVKPGTCIVIPQSFQHKEIKFWDHNFAIDNSLSYEDAVDRTRALLIDSVKLRLRSDVPLAFCMSGGIDSNSLISIAKNILNYDVHGFTIVNTDSRYEEIDMVQHAVQSQQLKYTPVEIKKENFLENLTNLIFQHDSPILTISYYIHWQLMNAISGAGYKVSISGTAADELFTGYYDHHNLYLKEISADRDLYNKSLRLWKKFQKPIVRNPFLQDPNLYIQNPEFRDHIYLDNKKFSSYMKVEWEESFVEKNFGMSLLRNRMMNELFYEAVPVILHEDDLNAMSFSIENRSPFLDSNLCKFAYSIPSKFLIKDGMAKAVLRDSMKGIVPDQILDNRRKVGFNAPFFDLFDINDKRNIDFLLNDSSIFEFVKKSSIERMITNETLLNSESKFLFYFLNAKIFLDNYQKII